MLLNCLFKVEDVKSRLDEAVCRLLYTCLSTTLLSETERLGYLNTGEVGCLQST